MKARSLTDEQEATLAREYESGATYEALAQRYMCSHGTVQNALRRQRATRRTRVASAASRRALTPEVALALAAEYLNGASLEVVAAKFGCSPGTARNILLRLGVSRRPCGQHPPRPVPKSKGCSSCEQELPCSDFYSKGRRSSECQKCVIQKQVNRYHTDPAYRQGRLDAERRRKTGWSTGQFEAMWEKQKGLCDICQVPMRRKGWTRTSVHADHDHATGQIRALLCDSCNRGLGCFEDSPEHLRRAAEYVEYHRIFAMNTGT